MKEKENTQQNQQKVSNEDKKLQLQSIMENKSYNYFGKNQDQKNQRKAYQSLEGRNMLQQQEQNQYQMYQQQSQQQLPGVDQQMQKELNYQMSQPQFQQQFQQPPQQQYIPQSQPQNDQQNPQMIQQQYIQQMQERARQNQQQNQEQYSLQQYASQQQLPQYQQQSQPMVPQQQQHQPQQQNFQKRNSFQQSQSQQDLQNDQLPPQPNVKFGRNRLKYENENQEQLMFREQKHKEMQIFLKQQMEENKRKKDMEKQQKKMEEQAEEERIRREIAELDMREQNEKNQLKQKQQQYQQMNIQLQQHQQFSQQQQQISDQGQPVGPQSNQTQLQQQQQQQQPQDLILQQNMQYFPLNTDVSKNFLQLEKQKEIQEIESINQTQEGFLQQQNQMKRQQKRHKKRTSQYDDQDGTYNESSYQEKMAIHKELNSIRNELKNQQQQYHAMIQEMQNEARTAKQERDQAQKELLELKSKIQQKELEQQNLFTALRKFDPPQQNNNNGFNDAQFLLNPNLQQQQQQTKQPLYNFDQIDNLLNNQKNLMGQKNDEFQLPTQQTSQPIPQQQYNQFNYQQPQYQQQPQQNKKQIKMYDKKGDTINDSEVFRELNQQMQPGNRGGIGELPSKQPQNQMPQQQQLGGKSPGIHKSLVSETKFIPIDVMQNPTAQNNQLTLSKLDQYAMKPPTYNNQKFNKQDLLQQSGTKGGAIEQYFGMKNNNNNSRPSSQSNQFSNMQQQDEFQFLQQESKMRPISSTFQQKPDIALDTYTNFNKQDQQNQNNFKNSNNNFNISNEFRQESRRLSNNGGTFGKAAKNILGSDNLQNADTGFDLKMDTLSSSFALKTNNNFGANLDNNFGKNNNNNSNSYGIGPRKNSKQNLESTSNNNEDLFQKGIALDQDFPSIRGGDTLMSNHMFDFKANNMSPTKTDDLTNLLKETDMLQQEMKKDIKSSNFQNSNQKMNANLTMNSNTFDLDDILKKNDDRLNKLQDLGMNTITSNNGDLHAKDKHNYEPNLGIIDEDSELDKLDNLIKNFKS